MYENVGDKIQVMARIIGIGLLTVGVIAFMILLGLAGDNSAEIYTTWAFVALGIGVMGWISSWFMYAFGQLVDDVHAMREKQDVKND